MPTTILSLQKCKAEGRKFSVLTAYDATFAHTMSQAGIDAILVGDSLGNVVQGRDSTIPVTLDQMVYHTECVARGNLGSLLMADAPFMGAATPETALESARALMQAGANVVKLEGGRWLAETTALLTRNGVPVCAHLGLTPQTVNTLGGYRVQGRDDDSARELMEAAEALDEAGAALIVLECVPRRLSAELTAAVRAPVIGIGAAPECDGQVLVMHDMLGLNPRPARFVHDFLGDTEGDIEAAFVAYDQAVKSGRFPDDSHCF